MGVGWGRHGLGGRVETAIWSLAGVPIYSMGLLGTSAMQPKLIFVCKREKDDARYIFHFNNCHC